MGGNSSGKGIVNLRDVVVGHGRQVVVRCTFGGWWCHAHLAVKDLLVGRVGELVERQLVRQLLLVVLRHNLHVVVENVESFLPFLFVSGVFPLVKRHKLVEDRTSRPLFHLLHILES